MLNPVEFHEWLLEQIDALTRWSQPEPEENVNEDAADVVREAGEIALLLGWNDLYCDCDVPSSHLAVRTAKELLGRCLEMCSTIVAREPGGLPSAGAKPKAVPATGARPKQLGLIYARAHSQFVNAERQIGSCTDRAAYRWLKEHEEERLPPYETWVRYVREARRTLGTRKNNPRAGRGGRSIITIDEWNDTYGANED